MTASFRSPLSKTILAGLLAALLAGCAVRLPEPIVGYACCNLHLQDGWIYSENYQSGFVIPAGTPIQITSIKRNYYAYGEAGSQSIGLYSQTGDLAETVAWRNRIIVPDNPAPKIAALPQTTRQAVESARIMPGMSRQEVLWAIAYPSRDDTPDLASNTWRYWMNDAEAVSVRFGADGKVSEIVGSPDAVKRLTYPAL